MDNSAMAVGGIVYLGLLVLALVVGVMWIIFPFMVLSKTNKMIDQQAEMLKIMAEVSHVANKSVRHLESIEKNVSRSEAQRAIFHYSIDNKQHGPITPEDLKAMHKDGLINDDTLVVREGDSEWKQYRYFLALNR